MDPFSGKVIIESLMFPKQTTDAPLRLRIPKEVCLPRLPTRLLLTTIDKVSLSFIPVQWRATEPATFVTLPVDIHLLILRHLHCVDGVCLGLTCKYIASIVSIASTFSSGGWTSFTDRSYCFLEPRTLDLLPRLAYGWVPKHQFGWCSWCFKIRTRDEKYWRAKLCKGKWLDWLPRLSLSRGTCVFISTKAQNEQIIRRWRDDRPQYHLRVRCTRCHSRAHSSLTCSPQHCPECAAELLVLR